MADKKKEQEINITTYNLCHINMFLHDVGFTPYFNIVAQTSENTAIKESEKLKEGDFAQFIDLN